MSVKDLAKVIEDIRAGAQEIAKEHEHAPLIRRAHAVAAELQSATEQLNTSIREVEQALLEAKVPACKMDVPFRGKLVCFSWDTKHLRWNNSDLLNASREVRMLASGHLPELFAFWTNRPKPVEPQVLVPYRRKPKTV